MDNVFITQYFDWDRPPPRRVRVVNAVLARLGFGARLTSPESTGYMSNVEQRMNMYHLVSGVLAYQVPGDVVEVGSHSGSSAVLYQKVIDQYDPTRRLHVYDAFTDPPVDVLLGHFRDLGLTPPVVHQGWFADTLPGELPDRVCFANVDVGHPTQTPADLEASIRLALESLYPRMPAGAVCLLTDYCDPDVYARQGFRFPRCISDIQAWNVHPGVKRACDDFFRGKPEQMVVLYSGRYSHGFFRKK